MCTYVCVCSRAPFVFCVDFLCAILLSGVFAQLYAAARVCILVSARVCVCVCTMLRGFTCVCVSAPRFSSCTSRIEGPSISGIVDEGGVAQRQGRGAGMQPGGEGGS